MSSSSEQESNGDEEQGENEDEHEKEGPPALHRYKHVFDGRISGERKYGSRRQTWQESERFDGVYCEMASRCGW